MATTPELKSTEQLLGELITTVLARSQVLNDVRPGGVLASILEAVASANFRITADMMGLISSLAVDRATGVALQRLANDKGVTILSAIAATGFVDISDVGFQKIETKVYAGLPAPVAGSITIYVADASAFSATGQIYIGRGTQNVEGPLSYTSVTPLFGGIYYAVTLDNANPTVKFHNLGESVVLAQGGDRNIPTGTIVQTQQTNAAVANAFSTTESVKILDGETTVTGVPVVAQLEGSQGNVSRGAIVDVLGVSFDARCTNGLPFTSGRDDDTDEVLRERIKRAEQARAKGTEAAIIEASLNVSAPDELKRVLSAAVTRSPGAEQTLSFDDGTGYEPISGGVGIERIVDSALGGEKEFQLDNPMLVPASVVTDATSPFNLSGTESLIVDIEGAGQYSHIFSTTDFRVPGQGTAFEVVASINSNFNLPFVARSLNGGQNVSIYAKTAKNIDVSGGTANTALAFPTRRVYTARIYKNDTPLFEEGLSAFATTLSQTVWGVVSSGATFKYDVDSTPTQVVTLLDSDFQKYGSSFTVSKDTPIDIWQNVLNDKLPGLTTTVVDDKLRIESNLGNSARAKLKIYTETLSQVGTAFFGQGALVESSGRASDYLLNRKTAQFTTTLPLQVGDTLTSGTSRTEARAESGDLPTVLNLGSDNLYLWLTVDGTAQSIVHKVTGAITITKNPGGYPTNTAKLQSINSDQDAFANVRVGDRVIFWKNPSESFVANGNVGVFRVYAIDTTGSSNFFVIDAPESVNQTVPGLPVPSRLTIIRSETPVQTLVLDPAVVTTPALLRDAVNAQIVGAVSELFENSVRIESKTADEVLSEIFIAAFTDGAIQLGLSLGANRAVPSHAGFSVSDKEEGLGFPTFKLLRSYNSSLSQTISDKVSTESIGKYRLNGGTGNDFLRYNAWGAGYFVNVSGVIDSYPFAAMNQGAWEKVSRYNVMTQKVEPLRVGLTYRGVLTGANFTYSGGGYYANEPYSIRQGLELDATDNLTLIVDRDPNLKGFVAPVARKVVVAANPAPTPLLLRLNDGESTLAFNHPSTFLDFNFDNFKLWTKAKTKLVTGTGGTDNIDLVWTDFGPFGSSHAIELTVPAAPNSDIGYTIQNGPLSIITISTGSGADIGSSADASTSFSIDTLTSIGGLDFVRYIWQAGQAPNLSVNPGDIVRISNAASFLPIHKNGAFRVTDNANYTGPSFTGTDRFTVERPADPSIVSDLLSVSPGGIVYPASVTLPAYGQPTPIQVDTDTPHNLSGGDVAGLYNMPVSNFEGVAFSVTEAISSTAFRGELTNIPGGQITQVARFSPANATAWDSTVTYAADDVVSESSNTYISRIAGNVNNDPATVPSAWQLVPSGQKIAVYQTATPHNISAGDLVKVAQVANDASSFNIASPTAVFAAFSTTKIIILQTGSDVNLVSATGTNPRLDLTFVISASADRVAKGLKSSTALSSFSVISTQQDLADYINSALSQYMVATPESPTAAVAPQLQFSFYNSEAIEIYPIYQEYERYIVMTTQPTFTKGALIQIVLPSSGNPLRADISGQQLQVLNIDSEMVPGQFVLTVRTNRLALTTDANYAGTASSFTASQMAFGFSKAESFVRHSDLSASLSTSSPNFELKDALALVPGDEGYLVATDSDQLARLLGRLANSGVSAVSSVDTATLGTALQVKTDVFGSDGAVQFAGGRANSHAAAVLAEGFRDGVAGVEVLWDLRAGFVTGSFVRLENTVKQAKRLGLDETTTIAIAPASSTTVVTMTGPGAFSIPRAATPTASGNEWKLERQGDFLCFTQTAGTSAAIETNVLEGDFVVIDETGQLPANLHFMAQNVGTYRVVRVYGDSFWVENSGGVNQYVTGLISGSIKFFSADSVLPGDTLKISTNLFGSDLVGEYEVQAATATTLTLGVALPFAVSATPLGADFELFQVIEATILTLIKQVQAVSGAESGTDRAWLGFETPDLVDRMTAVFGAGVTAYGKLAAPETIKPGLDGYRFYEGLTRELYKVIYGDPNDPTNSGIRAAGTDINIDAALTRRISVTLDVRIKTGIPSSEVSNAAKSAAASYINSLGVGQVVSLSALTSTVQDVSGVLSVVVSDSSPVASSGIILVLPGESARVGNPDTEILVNIIGT